MYRSPEHGRVFRAAEALFLAADMELPREWGSVGRDTRGQDQGRQCLHCEATVRIREPFSTVLALYLAFFPDVMFGKGTLLNLPL